MIFENELKNFVSANFNIWSTLFWWHQKRELKRHKAFFDSVEKQLLTDLQRRSIILDERRNLVVAGAGTGKTSVIVAKAGYLLKSGKCRPEEILLLAFNSPAAAELRERCEKRLGTIIEALTFHKLGKTIIEAAAGHSQTVSKLATDPAKFQNLIDDYIQEIQRNPEKWKKFRAFVLGHLKPYRSEIEFDTLDKYIAYIRSVDLRSLSGDLVKSFAELDIANFLFLMGVPFEYERRYPHVKKSYQPDFYLPDQDLYIEHFGIDRDGGTAPFIDSDIYRRGMEWKRDLHQKNGTKLRETYSWQRSEGVLLEAVIEIMKEHSVEYAPRSDEEVLEAIKTCGYVTQLSHLLSTFLNHFKSNQLHFSELRKRAQNSDAPKRSGLFVDLFIEICERYEDALHQNEDEIDFNDMISQATSLIQDGRYRVPWKYLIVDEFQDISVGRYKLLDAMLKTREDFRFFAVGDDWQSIYRFGGSDISIMSQFRDFFGRATVVKLEKTFRFNDRIAEVSGKFIQRNPKQIRKTLSTVIHKPKPQVFLHVKTRK